MKSGSQSAVPPAPRHKSAKMVAAGPAGNVSRASARNRTQPSGCVSAENQTMPGITVDDGAEWLHLLDLLDAVLQNDDDGALVAQSGQPARRRRRSGWL